MSKTALSLFHPLIRKWFRQRIGKPTRVQVASWPKIAEGQNLLVTAPTGSGKTLTAFLWAMDRLLSGKCGSGKISALYISPLKALNNDIRRNLLTPLSELKILFEKEGMDFPQVKVATRSGDTPQSERRRMLRHPPEILITTPESLNNMMSSKGGQSILTGIEVVIMDEIHGVFGTRRGVHLITAVDRLVELSGEFQRIALSATIAPLKTVADFIGGYTLSGDMENPSYHKRPVHVISMSMEKKYAVSIRHTNREKVENTGETLWETMARDLKRVIRRNRATLLFTASRRLCEKITHLLNSGEEDMTAYTHHGSLSREIRFEVEEKMKKGELSAVVATNSLEMGIDIGSLDEVVLIQSPPSVSSAIQRIGRAGHGVGEISRGTIYPSHAKDFIEAAVLARAVKERDIEAVSEMAEPLDVLAQVIVSMTGTRTWDIDELFNYIRAAHPYRNLSRKRFSLVLDMLGGRYGESRIRELAGRISMDLAENSVVAKKGALLALYMSGGTIPDRGYFQLRQEGSGHRIGELDEEFVWEAKIGQTFTLGAQNWKIEKITHDDVFVRPASPSSLATPFWIAESRNRDFHFSEKILNFLSHAEENLEEEAFKESLGKDYAMEKPAAEELCSFLMRHKEKTGAPLPHRRHILVERIKSGPGGAPGNHIVLHTFWGGRINRPLGMALSAAWEERFGQRLEVFAENDCIVLILPGEIAASTLLSLVSTANVDELIRSSLEGSGFFGARFRECAGRALLVERKKFNRRMPLWMTRLKSQKLQSTVAKYKDFPVLLEAWRTCLVDEFDLKTLKLLLAEIEAGEIGWTEITLNRPSPLALTVTWDQVNKYMYMDDEPPAQKRSNLSGNLIEEVVCSEELRPQIPAGIIREFEARVQRIHHGYSPSSPRDLVDLVKERWIMPESEWKVLISAMKRDHGVSAKEIAGDAGEKLAVLGFPVEEGIEELDRSMEQLNCHPLGCELWEKEVFPCRVKSYDPMWLDSLLQESDLMWIGSDKKKVSFCFGSDLDLFFEEEEETAGEANTPSGSGRTLFPDPEGRYDFLTLLRITGMSSRELSEKLWKGVFSGRIVNDGFSALRKGIENRFKVQGTTVKTRPTRRRSAPRRGFSMWKGTIPYGGNWMELPLPEPEDDLLAAEERKRDRARVLLDRYGIVFRELLMRESAPFQWPQVFRSLRLMELSGEVFSGSFFSGIPGPQFASARAIGLLRQKLPGDLIYWINCCDPASLCGLGIDALKGTYPRRLPGSHMVFKGHEVVALSSGSGKEMQFNVPPDDERIGEILEFTHHLLGRKFMPHRKIRIEKINKKDAAKSEYAYLFRSHFDAEVDNRTITLYRKI